MSQELSDYAASHCTQCVAGWKRTNKSGEAELSCLLDNQPILTDLTGCNRYEHKDAPATTAAFLRREHFWRR
jgi:hypothetical protein